MVSEREPPQDIDAEEAVLGSLLLDPEAIFKVATFLNPGDFYREKNRWSYEACLVLYGRNEAINQITVAYELRRQGRLEAVEVDYLSYLVSKVPTSVGIESYAQNVYRASMMRKLISASKQIAAIGYESPPDIDDTLDQAEGILFQLRHGQPLRGFIHIRDVLDRYFEESGFVPRDGFLPRVPTGFVNLDKILGGMQRSDMLVLASRPSLGKTSLALNIARNAALPEEGPKAKVALFSLEMSKMELAYRFLSSETGIDTQRIRLDELTDGQRDDIQGAMGRLSEAPIYIDDSPFLRDSDLRSKARRLHSEKGIDLIIVDYIQLMRSSRHSDNRVQEMSEISFSLKELARELNVPVLAVSQLSRAVETRSPHIPMLSDLRESGSIEQDADVVMFIYREDMYYTQEEWERRFPDKHYPKNIAQILIAKHRNGPLGRVDLRFRDKMAKFESYARVTEKASLL
jgi:replicative DNA helicase